MKFRLRSNVGQKQLEKIMCIVPTQRSKVCVPFGKLSSNDLIRVGIFLQQSYLESIKLSELLKSRIDYLERMMLDGKENSGDNKPIPTT